jgi:betaine-aldehyde dehydrogenase
MTKFLNVIDGASVPALSGATAVVVSPVSGRPYAEAADSGIEDVDAACDAARRAFLQWRRTTPVERSRALLSAADALETRAEEICRVEVEDTGKPFASMSNDEIPPTLDQLRFFAGAARMLEGRAVGEYADPSITSAIRREPVGVCAQITPWNYPFMMAVWKWGPAVAAGNTVVLKPSEHTPASTVRMAQILSEVLPPGVLNVVCGGPSVGEALARHAVPAMVSLTGSVRAGRAVAGAAADSVKRVHLELGGNAPVIVFDDVDIADTAEKIAAAGFGNAGQDCTAATRVLVSASVYDDFVAALAKSAEALRTGDPYDPHVDFGPLITEQQLARVRGFLERLGPHAEIVAGGHALDRDGFFHEATVVAGVQQGDEIVQEEVFGPVITVQSFTSEEEAAHLANDVVYGLTASVWTSDHARAQRLVRDLDFGAVSVNAHAPMAAEMPHGGFGISGYGKDLGVYGLEDYTRIKHIAHAF